MAKVQIGSISSGTCRTEDLLEAFADELDYQVSHGSAGSAEHADELRKLVAEARAADPDDELADELVCELQDALSELAPSYVYFGANEGDGADFGWWPAIDALEEAAENGEVLKLPAGDDIPADYLGEVMFVTDHGNVSFGYVEGETRKFVELWSCV